MKEIKDIPYATVDGHTLCLDLYLPAHVETPPLVVSMHGGAWRRGSREGAPNPALIAAGYAVAKIDYRLLDRAIFPAQIHDCKAAVRWLRAHAARYGYDTTRVGAHGNSAGGHLALLLAFTAGNPRLEGTVGEYLNHSSHVDAVVEFYGPTDLVMRTRDQPRQTNLPGGRVYDLLGGSVRQNLELAKLASPAWQVKQGDPPVLAFHGTLDKIVLVNQLHRLVEACKEAGVPIEHRAIEEAAHGEYKTPGHIKYFNTEENWHLVTDFLDRHLKDAPPGAVASSGSPC